jgi:hypothetical protein
MIPILETKELHDAKADVAAGLESLMKRAVKSTMPPEQKEAHDRAEMQKVRDAAIVRAIDINNRYWWVFADCYDSVSDLWAYGDREWRSGGEGWWRIVGHDPDVFTLFREMDAPHRARMLERMRAADLPQTIHPMQLTDLATGEYSVSA